MQGRIRERIGHSMDQATEQPSRNKNRNELRDQQTQQREKRGGDHSGGVRVLLGRQSSAILSHLSLN